MEPSKSLDQGAFCAFAAGPPTRRVVLNRRTRDDPDPVWFRENSTEHRPCASGVVSFSYDVQSDLLDVQFSELVLDGLCTVKRAIAQCWFTRGFNDFVLRKPELAERGRGFGCIGGVIRRQMSARPRTA